jgi:hypothetical protein
VLAQEQDADGAVRKALDDSSAGQPLLPGPPQELAGELGVDPVLPRIHTDARAAELASALDAQAFTRGRHVYFGDGRYQPQTPAGAALLRHELVHVRQQDRGELAGHERRLVPPAHASEAEADAARPEQTRPRRASLSASTGSDAIQRKPDDAARRPVLGGSSGPKAQITAVKHAFHARMTEAESILEETRSHYETVNGIYAANFRIVGVVVGQAREEELRNEQIREGLLAGASLVLPFVAPEAAAAGLLAKILEMAHWLDERREQAEKLGKVVEAVWGGGEEHAEGGGEAGPPDPREVEIASLKRLLDLHEKVTRASNAGNAVLDATDGIAANDAAALARAATACQELSAKTDSLLADLRDLRTRRRGLTIPSWREVEQDIWISYFVAHRRVATADVLRNHMVDIGLWGPRGHPGGRLGIAEFVEGTFVRQSYEAPKVVPAHEDVSSGQSVAQTELDWMQVIGAEEKTLSAKWRRLMLAPGGELVE